MAQGYFVAPMTCPHCGHASDGSDMRLAHHLLSSHGALLRPGDRIPVSPMVLANDFLWVRLAEPGAKLHLLTDGACRACHSIVWAELVVDAGVIEEIRVVPFERDVLARQHWVTDEVWTRFTGEVPPHGLWAALVRSLPGDAAVADLTPLELELEGVVLRFDTTGRGPIVVVPAEGSGRALAQRLESAWEARREDDPTLTPAIAHLTTLASAWDVPNVPVLFTRTPTSDTLQPADEVVLNGLEREAEWLDAGDAMAEVGAEPAYLLEQRRAFLVRLREAGLFDDERREARGRALYENWSDRLRAWFLAYEHLKAWGLAGSAEDPLDGPVCIDYARFQLWPQGADAGVWATRAVALLGAEDGDQGFVVEHSGGAGVRVWWRRDAGRPALLAIEQLER